MLQNDTPRARPQALERDGYRCMMSGNFDATSYLNDPHLQAQFDDINASGGHVLLGATHLCHILSESANDNLNGPDEVRTASVRSKLVKLM